LNDDRKRILWIVVPVAALILIAYYSIQCQVRIGQSAKAEKFTWFSLHFLLYAWLAWMFPHEWLFLFAIGAVWEVFEHYVRKLGESRQGARDYKWFHCKKAKTAVLYEEWSDIIANSLGLCVGVFACWYVHQNKSLSNASSGRRYDHFTHHTGSMDVL
jgi:hypothetical protein